MPFAVGVEVPPTARSSWVQARRRSSSGCDAGNDVFLCAMLAASQAAIGMVVQEAHGPETGFRIGDKPFRIEVFADSSVSTDWVC